MHTGRGGLLAEADEIGLSALPQRASQLSYWQSIHRRTTVGPQDATGESEGDGESRTTRDGASFAASTKTAKPAGRAFVDALTGVTGTVTSWSVASLAPVAQDDPRAARTSLYFVRAGVVGVYVGVVAHAGFSFSIR